LDQDIKLDSEAFNTAAADMAALKTRAETLKEKLQKMYTDITTALDTPAGHEIEITAEDVLIQPIDDLILVIDQMSRTLDEIISTQYYQSVFDKYDELVESINF
jgi:molecular chaperone GrpE (heat shock protein)